MNKLNTDLITSLMNLASGGLTLAAALVTIGYSIYQKATTRECRELFLSTLVNFVIIAIYAIGFIALLIGLKAAFFLASCLVFFGYLIYFSLKKNSVERREIVQIIIYLFPVISALNAYNISTVYEELNRIIGSMNKIMDILEKITNHLAK